MANLPERLQAHLWADRAGQFFWLTGVVTLLGMLTISLTASGTHIGPLAILLTGLIWFVPIWRFTTWLKMVSRGKADLKDLIRVRAWLLAGQLILILASLAQVAGFLTPRAVDMDRIGALSIAMLYMAGVIFINRIRDWAKLQTDAQKHPMDRETRLRPLLIGNFTWFRIMQCVLLISNLIWIFTRFPERIPAGMFGLMHVTALNLALEFTWRFACDSVSPVQPDGQIVGEILTE